MTCIITKASLDRFQNALGVNRRADWKVPQDEQRVHQINISIDPTYDIVSAVAGRLWEHRAQVRLSTGQEFRSFMDDYYTKVAKIRLSYWGDAQTPVRQVGGYIVLNGELLALHSMVRGSGLWLLDHAINDGATHLSCVDEPALVRLYHSRGFREVRRELNTTKGRPDMVWMELPK